MSELRRLFRFGLVGTIGFVVDTTVLFVVIGSLGPYAGRAASFLAAVLTTWIVNRRYTFGDRSSGRLPAAEFANYLLVMLIGGSLNYGVYAAVVATLGAAGMVPLLGVALGSLAGLVVNLTLARTIVFRRPREGGDGPGTPKQG